MSYDNYNYIWLFSINGKQYRMYEQWLSEKNWCLKKISNNYNSFLDINLNFQRNLEK